MKKIGLIDNLNNITGFNELILPQSNSTEWMKAVGGNTGNIAFVHGAICSIQSPVERINWNSNPQEVRERCNHLVISCANQLGAHADLASWADKLELFDLPVTLVGIGIQTTNYENNLSLPTGSFRFLEVVQNLKSESGITNIGVRGELTKEFLLKSNIKSHVIGCPSLFISSKDRLGNKLRETNRRKPKKIAVAAGNPWHASSYKIEKILMEIVDCFGGAYIIQHPETMLKIFLGEINEIPNTSLQQCLLAYGGKFEISELVNWYRDNAIAFSNVGSWMQYLRKFDRVIGPRYHGVALGLQAGVPGYVMHIDNRTKELSESTGIKNFPASFLMGKNKDELVGLADWCDDEINHFEFTREKNARIFAGMLLENGITASKHITSLF